MQRILVVDDQESILVVLSELLALIGFDVVVATSGSEGLTKFLKDPFDLVLTDLKMSGMDGLSFAIKIKQQSSTTPVILMTGEPKEAVSKKLKRNLIDSVLFKPFEFKDVQKTIKGVLDSRPLEVETLPLARSTRA